MDDYKTLIKKWLMTRKDLIHYGKNNRYKRRYAYTINYCVETLENSDNLYWFKRSIRNMYENKNARSNPNDRYEIDDEVIKMVLSMIHRYEISFMKEENENEN